MGCVNGKKPRPPHLEDLKRKNGYCKRVPAPKAITQNDDSMTHSYIKHVGLDVERSVTLNAINGGGNVGGKDQREGKRDRDRGVARDHKIENKGEVGNGNVSKRIEEKKINARTYESVDGWPKWLVDNIPKDVLANLVPKSADSYEKLDKIGRGTYSNVYKARDKVTGKIVALKKVRFDTSDSESIKFMAREIMILQKLDHPNVIKLEGLATSRMQYSLYLVFEFMQSDLTRIISGPERLTEAQVKCFMRQLLSGLQHCHERGVMHRDIKPSNLLVDKRGNLKIADFGLANYSAIKPLTNRVVTLWYRAPELLLGSTDYGSGIDLWSAGCLLAEMFHERPLLPGRTEVEELHMIFKLCGSPSEDYWKKMKLMTTYRFPQHYKPTYHETFQHFPSSSHGLLTTLLNLDPEYRGSASSALESEFFKARPFACDPLTLPVIYKGEDERSQTKRRKRHKGLKKKGQLSQTSRSHASQLGKNQTGEPKRDSESSKEAKSVEQNMQGQETNNSGSSTSSGSRLLFMNEGSNSTNASISPVFVSSRRKSPKTEGHPNALKNLKNYASLLQQASMIDFVNNRNEGNESVQLRRSFSALEFRFDPEKLSNLHGLSKKLGHKFDLLSLT